jgi:hypothetical protein
VTFPLAKTIFKIDPVRILSLANLKGQTIITGAIFTGGTFGAILKIQYGVRIEELPAGGSVLDASQNH